MASRAAVRRTRETGSEATRRAILDAAEALLAKHGEDGLSIREVCLRAGVSPPTIYHHFGDKAGLVDRVVDDCFAAFERFFEHRAPPADPVDQLRWGFDRYLEYGVAHAVHYRLMFQRAHGRPTPTGLVSYDRLRRAVQAAYDGGRLRAGVDDATAALWSSVHGVTSLVIAGFWRADAPAIALVRDAILAQLTRPAARRATRKRGPRHGRP